MYGRWLDGKTDVDCASLRGAGANVHIAAQSIDSFLHCDQPEATGLAFRAGRHSGAIVLYQHVQPPSIRLYGQANLACMRMPLHVEQALLYHPVDYGIDRVAAGDSLG